MILRDPTYIKSNLKGLFVWESSWEGHPDPQDGKLKLGVQITPIQEILHAYQGKGHVFIRQLICPPNLFNNEKLLQIHNVVYDKPYDIVPKIGLKPFLKQIVILKKQIDFGALHWLDIFILKQKY